MDIIQHIYQPHRGHMDLAKLLELIDERFSLEDVRTLCFYTAVDYDNLGGDGKRDKARELIIFLNNRGQLPKLLEAMTQVRPQIDLSALTTAEPIPEPPPKDLAQLRERYGRQLTNISRALQRGRLTPFVGGDLDTAITGQPSRQNIADALANQEGIGPGQRLAAVAQQAMGFGKRFTFTNLLRDLLDSAGKQPQPFHKLLAGVAQENRLETLITTVYGDLLEAGFRSQNVGLNIVVNDEDLAFTNPDQTTLLKLYGDWRQPASLIVTEQDENQLLRGRLKADIVDEVRRVFRRNTVLFLGYDLGDTAVSALFDEMAGDRFQQAAFAVWSGLPPRTAESLASNRGIEVLDCDPILLLQALLAT